MAFLLSPSIKLDVTTFVSPLCSPSRSLWLVHLGLEEFQLGQGACPMPTTCSSSDPLGVAILVVVAIFAGDQDRTSLKNSALRIVFLCIRTEQCMFCVKRAAIARLYVLRFHIA